MGIIPKVSVITPTFNQAKFIEGAIQSVWDQNYPNVEHIVVDGGSTDGTLEILERYRGRVRWISGKDKGQADAVNKGFLLATGEIIGWLNSDDIYLPGAIWTVVNFFQGHPDVQWLYGSCRIIDEQGRDVRKWITQYKNLLGRRFSYRILLLENFISQPSVFLKRTVIESIGLLDVDRYYAMDYEYWLRVARRFEPGVIRQDLACFRIHPECKSHLGFRKQFREELQVARTYSKGNISHIIHGFNSWKIVTLYSVMNWWTSRKDSTSRRP